MSRRRGQEPDLHGVLLVDKPAGPTSHDVVAWVRWALGVRRVGHCGTLDPAATGLLVVAVGGATKLASLLTGQDKGYRAQITLGRSTTTADAQGQTTQQRPCPAGLEGRVEAAIRGLVGTQQLAPPAFSAVHVQGQRAHALARAGQALSLPARAMTVHHAELRRVWRDDDRVRVDVHLLVSKGTYIRSLAEALGARLEVPAHLAELHRTHSGALSMSHPRALPRPRAEALEPAPRGHPRWRLRLDGHPTRPATADALRAHWLMPAEVVPCPLCRVHDDPSGQRALARLASGQPVPLDDPGLVSPPSADRLAVVPAGPDAAGLILVHRSGEGSMARWHPERVIVAPRCP